MNPSAVPLTSNYHRDTVVARRLDCDHSNLPKPKSSQMLSLS